MQSNVLPRSVIYVSVKLTVRSGITMQTLRLRRYLYKLAGEPWVTILGREFGYGVADLVRAHRAGVTFLQLAIAHLDTDS